MPVVARARRFWIDHLWVDLLLATLFVGVHIALVFAVPVADLLGQALPGDRRNVYTSTAVVVSLLSSFSGVAIGQLGSAGGLRAKALREQAGEALSKNWGSIFRSGLLATLIALIALLLDPSIHVVGLVPVITRWVFEFALLLALVKFMRLSALFSEVLTVKSKSEAEDDGKEELAEAPQLGPRWQQTAA